MFKKSLLTLTLLSATAISQSQVLTTIKPLGFIANAISDDVVETQVLLPTNASPHDYSLKPSDIERLQSAQLIVWIGDEMERFLKKSIEKFPKEKILTLEDIPAIKSLVEETEKEEEEEEEHNKHSHTKAHDHSHEHNHDEDWHIWLSPQASEVIAEHIAERLTQLYPEQQTKIATNLNTFKSALHQKHEEIKQQLSAYTDKGYYTFHDAYRHFEQSYGLTSLGSFTINPTVAPGAKTLAKIKKNLAEKKAHCLFTEPQFTPKVIESLRQGTAAQVGQLDPLGEKITLSKDAYPQFLQSIADEFATCLAK